ncbi:hypothetical protein FJTKL_11546 [Diaporthe vaccinii]|uniref:Uncharacterized protein n=2 Tax=Diaporthe TaxID=36922 RepID=A0ABR4EGZ3_9PEZI
MEEGQGGLPPPATLEPISRPSSTSTTASHSHQQLPGISSIAAAAAAAAAATSTSSPPQMRAMTSTPSTMYSTPATAPAATSAGPGGNLVSHISNSFSFAPLSSAPHPIALV